MNIFGILLGFLLPSFFVNGYNGKEDLTDEKKSMYEQQLFNLLLFSAIVASVIAVANIFTFREKPGAPLWKSEESEQV